MSQKNRIILVLSVLIIGVIGFYILGVNNTKSTLILLDQHNFSKTYDMSDLKVYDTIYENTNKLFYIGFPEDKKKEIRELHFYADLLRQNIGNDEQYEQIKEDITSSNYISDRHKEYLAKLIDYQMEQDIEFSLDAPIIVSDHEDIDYKVWAKELIKRSLKSPSSAKFGDVTILRENGSVTAKGYVDADNSLGANIRTTYAVVFANGDMDDYVIVTE